MKDYIVRATAANGQVRAFAATTRGVVETARKDHNTSPIATVALGRLLTGAAMMGIIQIYLLSRLREMDQLVR